MFSMKMHLEGIRPRGANHTLGFPAYDPMAGSSYTCEQQAFEAEEALYRTATMWREVFYDESIWSNHDLKSDFS